MAGQTVQASSGEGRRALPAGEGFGHHARPLLSGDPCPRTTSSPPPAALLAGVIALAAAASAPAATDPDYLLVDKSSDQLIDDATVQSLFAAFVSPKMARLYPTNKWGFGVQVEGGLTQANTPVSSRRA